MGNAIQSCCTSENGTAKEAYRCALQLLPVWRGHLMLVRSLPMTTDVVTHGVLSKIECAPGMTDSPCSVWIQQCKTQGPTGPMPS